MNSLDARTSFTNIRRQLSGFVVAAAVAMMSLVMAPSAHATIGTCDTAGPVEVEATGAGPGPTAYATLAAAVTAINAGTHTGAINVEVCANTTETAAMFLNSSGAGAASYTSILIRPLADGLTISGPTVTGRGLIELNGADNVTIDGDNPNSGGTNRNLTITNTAVATVVANSVIRIATIVTTVASADNNTIKNLILNGNVTGGNSSLITLTTSSSGISFGIVAGGGATTATTAPAALAAAAGTAAPSGTTINNLTVDNNQINQCARGVQFNGAATTVATALAVTNNTIGASGAPAPATPPYTSPTTTVYGKGIAIQGTNALTVTGNTIQNVLSYVGIAMAGIETTTLIGTGSININNNAISTVVLNSTASIPARGIASLTAGAAYSVKGNAISDIENFSGSSGNQPNGILINTTGGAATVDSNTVTKIYNRATGTFGAQGITLSAGNNHIVKNNFVSDVNQVITGGASFDATFGVVGIRVFSGTGHKIYHNSVNMFGAALGTAAASNMIAAFGIAATGLTGCDVRNNIFSNTMTTAGATSAYVSVFLPASGTTANMNLIWNNNAYYTGATAGLHGVAAVGTSYLAAPAGPTTYQGLYTAANFNSGATSPNANLRAYTTTLSAANTNDNASFATTSAAPFTSSTNLHIPAATATQLESTGAPVGVAVDIDNEGRSGTTPDIGADEFAGIFVDLTPPSIVYTTLSNTALTTNRTLNSTITDVGSGVPTVGIGLPVIYFRKGTSGAYASSQCTSGGGSAYSCLINYSLVTGGSVASGDTIQYWVAAQDGAATPNVTSNPSTGASGFTANPPNATTPTTAPNSYLIVVPLNGTKTVCASGCNYTSLTNAGGLFADINARLLDGNLFVEIQGDLTGETGANGLAPIAEEPVGGYTVKIYPTGAARSVTGTGTGGTLIPILGADRVTIDGSIGGTGTDRSLSFIQNNTASGTGNFFIASLGTGNGSTNITIKNCIIQDTIGTTANFTFGVFVGDITGVPAGADNDNFTFQNNQVLKARTALQMVGTAGGPNDNTLITGNLFGDNTLANSLGRIGMVFSTANNATITSNTIKNIFISLDTSSPIGMSLASLAGTSSISQNSILGIQCTGSLLTPIGIIASASTGVTLSQNTLDGIVGGFGGTGTGDVYGIALSTGFINSTVSRNTIKNITYNGTAGYAGRGIDINTGTATSGLTFSNNMISNIKGDGWNSFASDSIAGIRVTGTTGGLNFYANSVNLGSGTFAGNTTGTLSAAMYVGATTTTVDMRDNIFTTNLQNTNAAAAKSYGIYSDAAAGAFSNINYNDYFGSGTQGILGFIGAADKTTIATWRTATGGDLQSLSAAPGYVSSTDLHIDTSGAVTPVENVGFSLGTVTNDIDGDTRAPVPDIGADEVRCHTGVDVCNDGNVCTVDSCNPATGCVFTPGNLGTECRASAGICDVAETCDGTNAACPADGFVTGGTECRGSAGVCDVAEACTGSSAFCPADGFNTGLECRGSSGVCDVAESCDGSGASCPADGFNTGFQCRPSAGACDVAESCDGSGASCPADVLVTGGTECRGSAGVCDVAETCTGSSPTCPADGFNTGFECRPSAGICDVAESCDGSGASCPADILVAGGTECRGSAGVCDVAESCTGSSPSCPADGFNTGFECRPSAGQCDVAESCDGSGASCPADAFAAASTVCIGTANGGACDDDAVDHCSGGDNTCVDAFKDNTNVCRPATGQCDVAESCTGAASDCPADAFALATASCTGSSQGGACDDDPADHCSGTGDTCVDVYQSSGFECRASAGQCDVAETCTGSSGACPADVFATAVTLCTGTANGGACDDDPADHCSGTDNSCVDAYQASGFECRASAGQCDVAETCSGSSSSCPADAFALATTLCTGTIQGGACDNDAADHCTGTDNSCVDVYRAAGFECRPSAGQCDVAETCDGSSSTCPADVVATSATSCVGTANGGACDNDAADHCTGTNNNCVDVFRDNTFTCRSSVGSCDVAETCTGSSSTCPADVLVASGTTCRPSTGACDPAETCNGSSGSCPADVLGGPVTVLSTTGTAGGVPTSYATLGPAFVAINAGGTHTGAIAITICSSISEGATPATLNSSGAGSASYTSVSIRPAAPGITVTGNPASGFGVVQLNGADNVTIDGDDPNTPGINRDLTISNTAAAAVTANSAVRIAVSTTGVTSADNDTIKNCNLNGNVTGGNASGITSTASSSGISFGIFAGGGGGASAIGAPVALAAAAGTSAPAGTTINALTIDNNAVNQAARAIAFNGIAAASSTSVTVTNNVIGTAGAPAPAYPATSPATTVYNKGVVIQGATTVNVSNNSIQNVMSFVGIATAGVELTSVIGAGPNVVSGNTIAGVILNAAGGFSSRGVSVLASTGAYTVGGNTISNVQNSCNSVTITNQPNGMFVNTTATSATIENNRVTGIIDRNAGTFGVGAVHLSGGNNITFRNNFVSDVNQDITGGAAFSTTFGMHGLRISAGTGHKIYHNSINLFGPTLGTAASSILSSAFTITATGLTGYDVRNNIFANTMTGGTTSIAHVATFLPASGTTANMNLTWNNNAYYTGSTAGVHGVCHVGTAYTAVPAGPTTWAGLYTAANFSAAATTPNSNFRAYTSTLTAGGLNDNQALASSAAAPFTTSTNLHINTGLSPTSLESHGAAIGVVSDIDGDVRPGPSGSVNGGATAPDLGADEFDGVPPLANDIQATAFVDPTNGGTKAAGVAFSPQASFTNNGTAAQTGVTVRYRILDAGSFEVYNNTQSIASIVSGATATVTFASTSLSAGSYTIKAKAELAGDQVPANDEITGALVVEAPLCGNYNVGSGGVFASLTNAGGAFSKLNALGASCSVTFSIISDLTGETGTVAVGPWGEFGGSGYTLTIKPSGGVRSISGDSSTAAVRALIRLDGADRVTIDGSLTGTDRSLTITNADLSTASAVINVSSGAAGAQNDTVKNTIVVGSSNTATFIGIGFGGAAVASLGTDNDNNRVENCDIRKVQFGVATQGATVANKDTGTVLTKNLMNSTGTNSIGRGAIVASFEDGIQITDNTIGGIVNAASVDAFGISLGGLIGWGNTTTTGGSEVSNAVVTGNKIGTVQQTNTFSAAGIVVTPATTGTNRIANNFISGVIANGTAPDFGAGIFVIESGTDSTTRIYHNSISMVGTLTASDQPQYALAVNGTNPTLDVRNNILRNVQSTGTTTLSYAIGLGYAAFTNLTSDNNDLFVTATGNFRIGRTVSIAATGGTDAATLANWQTATGKDAASKNVAPNFVSDTDLHLDISSAATAIENAGVFLAAVPNDIDGDTRDNPAPDIGADELHCHTSVPAENCNDGSVCSVDTCSPVTGCVYTPGNGGTECRPSAGFCDVAESCNGSSAACPADGFVTGGICRASADVCDLAESCTGSSAFCPADGFVAGGTECRASAGACDPAEACTGSSAACPADLLADSSTVCRGAAGTCDYAENCTGASPTCPADAVVTAGTECRASAGDCDLAESCDGFVGSCPADAFQPSSYECRASTATCDPAENCTGSSASCPADAVNQSAPVGPTVTASQSGPTTTITWTESLAGPFNVYRGSITSGAAFSYNHSCYANGVPGPSVTDPSNPTPGKLWYYLISRQQTPCGESNLGQDGSGADRPNAYACGSGSQDGDFDGVPDNLDNCPTISNASQDDADGDKHGDVCDNCISVVNDQTNGDGDALGDACDPDIDNDGFPNGLDNCPYAANDQTDTDGDGIGDACDETP